MPVIRFNKAKAKRRSNRSASLRWEHLGRAYYAHRYSIVKTTGGWGLSYGGEPLGLKSSLAAAKRAAEEHYATPGHAKSRGAAEGPSTSETAGHFGTMLRGRNWTVRAHGTETEAIPPGGSSDDRLLIKGVKVERNVKRGARKTTTAIADLRTTPLHVILRVAQAMETLAAEEKLARDRKRPIRAPMNLGPPPAGWSSKGRANRASKKKPAKKSFVVYIEDRDHVDHKRRGADAGELLFYVSGPGAGEWATAHEDIGDDQWSISGPEEAYAAIEYDSLKERRAIMAKVKRQRYDTRFLEYGIQRGMITRKPDGARSGPRLGRAPKRGSTKRSNRAGTLKIASVKIHGDGRYPGTSVLKNEVRVLFTDGIGVTVHNGGSGGDRWYAMQPFDAHDAQRRLVGTEHLPYQRAALKGALKDATIKIKKDPKGDLYADIDRRGRAASSKRNRSRALSGGGVYMPGTAGNLNKVMVRRLKVDRDGYTKQGNYFGRGAPLFEADDVDGAWYTYLRAADLKAAKAKLIAKYPKMKFTR